MTNKEIFDSLTNLLIENALDEFKATEEHRLLQEKMDQIEKDCDMELLPDNKAFVFECFDSLMEIGGRQEYYVYQKGLRDSVRILRWIGVLE